MRGISKRLSCIALSVALFVSFAGHGAASMGPAGSVVPSLSACWGSGCTLEAAGSIHLTLGSTVAGPHHTGHVTGYRLPSTWSLTHYVQLRENLEQLAPCGGSCHRKPR